jgi:hypothetical protein
MPELSKTACSGAFILHCSRTKQEIRGCFTDCSPESDNYRGELLGALRPLLLLTAAFKSRPDLDQDELLQLTQKTYFDNRGVVLHGNQPNSALKDGQKQADLISGYSSRTRENSHARYNGSISMHMQTITQGGRILLIFSSSTFGVIKGPRKDSITPSSLAIS